jgi:hypothetical protein
MHMTAPKFTRRRQKLFMTGTSGLRHLSQIKKYGCSTPNSGSSLVRSAPNGMARQMQHDLMGCSEEKQIMQQICNSRS